MTDSRLEKVLSLDFEKRVMIRKRAIDGAMIDSHMTTVPQQQLQQITALEPRNGD